MIPSKEQMEPRAAHELASELARKIDGEVRFDSTVGRNEDNAEDLDVVTYHGLRLTIGPTSEPELKSIIRQDGRHDARR